MPQLTQTMLVQIQEAFPRVLIWLPWQPKFSFLPVPFFSPCYKFSVGAFDSSNLHQVLLLKERKEWEKVPGSFDFRVRMICIHFKEQNFLKFHATPSFFLPYTYFLIVRLSISMPSATQILSSHCLYYALTNILLSYPTWIIRGCSL